MTVVQKLSQHRSDITARYGLQVIVGPLGLDNTFASKCAIRCKKPVVIAYGRRVLAGHMLTVRRLGQAAVCFELL